MQPALTVCPAGVRLVQSVQVKGGAKFLQRISESIAHGDAHTPTVHQHQGRTRELSIHEHT